MTNVGQKADYVRARMRRTARGHRCHWPGCLRAVPAAQWGCQEHWYKLPLYLRNKVWRAFRPGQEETKTPSREYVLVAREVEQWIKDNS